MHFPVMFFKLSNIYQFFSSLWIENCVHSHRLRLNSLLLCHVMSHKMLKSLFFIHYLYRIEVYNFGISYIYVYFEKHCTFFLNVDNNKLDKLSTLCLVFTETLFFLHTKNYYANRYLVQLNHVNVWVSHTMLCMLWRFIKLDNQMY